MSLILNISYTQIPPLRCDYTVIDSIYVVYTSLAQIPLRLQSSLPYCPNWWWSQRYDCNADTMAAAVTNGENSPSLQGREENALMWEKEYGGKKTMHSLACKHLAACASSNIIFHRKQLERNGKKLKKKLSRYIWAGSCVFMLYCQCFFLVGCLGKKTNCIMKVDTRSGFWSLQEFDNNTK